MCLGRVARRALEGDARLPLCGGGEFGLAAAPAKLALQRWRPAKITIRTGGEPQFTRKVGQVR